MKAALTAAGLADRGADARRQRRCRRLQDARHHGRQCRAAGLFRRRRDQGRAANVQGAQQAVRAGVLVARSRRHAAQSGRQPQCVDARHQRADLARRDQERRRQSRAVAQGARRARPRRDHRHHRVGRPRLLDHLQGKQDQPGRQGRLRRRAEGTAAARLPRARSRQGAGPAAARPRQQERARRGRRVPETRQRRDRQRCRPSPTSWSRPMAAPISSICRARIAH